MMVMESRRRWSEEESEEGRPLASGRRFACKLGRRAQTKLIRLPQQQQQKWKRNEAAPAHMLALDNALLSRHIKLWRRLLLLLLL